MCCRCSCSCHRTLSVGTIIPEGTSADMYPDPSPPKALRVWRVNGTEWIEQPSGEIIGSCDNWKTSVRKCMKPSDLYLVR